MKNKSRLGFTLVEMLIAVAILVTLLGVAGVSSTTIKRNLTQTKADATAREIFVAAQENLKKLNNSGNTDLDEGKPGVNSLGEYKPAGYKGENKIQYVTSNSEAGKLLLPEGTIDSNEYNNTWIIEYDPISGIVLGVFYFDLPNQESFYKNLAGDQKDFLRASKDNRLGYNDKFFIGYYGDGSDLENLRSHKSGIDANITLVNNDTLALTYSVTLDAEKYKNIDKVYFYISYTGNTSGKELVRDPIEMKLTNHSASLEEVLDTLQEGDVDISDPNGEFVKAGFVPGENITAQFTVKFGEYRSDDELLTFSSLFRACEDSEFTHTAKISYTRHLRNLGNVANSFVVGQAVQENDITVPESTESMTILFRPIVNSSLISYEGNDYYISNLVVTANEDDPGAGLFGMFGTTKANSEINDLYLIDTKVNGSAYSGALVGITSSEKKVTINNVGVYLTVNKTKDAPTAYITGNNAAGLIGQAGANTTINNSFAATVVEGATSAAGLVADGGLFLSVNNSYSDCYLSAPTVAGLVGVNKVENNALRNISLESCYAAGTTYGTTAPTTVYGLVSGDVKKASYVYTIFDITKATTNAYFLADSISTANFVRYVESASKIAKDVTQTGISKVAIDVLTSKDKLATNLGTGNFTFINNDKTKNHPYNFNGMGLETYPFPEIKGMSHYGDWTVDDGKKDKFGVFYWEKEVKDSDNSLVSYNYYLVYQDGKTIKENISKASEYDSKTHITDYGYGYVVKKTVTAKVTWDPNTVPVTGENQLNATSNSTVANAIKGKFDTTDSYNVYSYTTMNAFDSVTTNKLYLYNNGLPLDKNYTILTATIDGMNTIKYEFNPFFAADIAVDTTNEGKAYKNLKSHQIRSIEQLQFLNYNVVEKNCSTLTNDENYKEFPFLGNYDNTNNGSTTYEQTHDFECTHLNDLSTVKNKGKSKYTPIAAQETLLEKGSKHTEYHKAVAAEVVSEIIGESKITVYSWFNGIYNGNTYKISNLNISSDAYTIGLFGTTLNAKLDGIMIESTNKSIIQRIAGDTSINDYFLGGLVGLHLSSSSTSSNIINNCGIGGYKIIDYSNQPTTLGGGSAVGGLIGASLTRVSNCSAVVDIEMRCTSGYGATVVGGLIGNACGSTINNEFLSSIKGAINIISNLLDDTSSDQFKNAKNSITALENRVNNAASVSNCYTGGSINFYDKAATNGKFTVLADGFKGYYVGGVVGSNKNTNIKNVYHYNEKWNHNITIYECYTYMTLPEKSSKDNIESIGAIFATSFTHAFDNLYQNLTANTVVYGGMNIIYDCYYYDKDCGFKDVGLLNFIEREDYLSDVAKDKLLGEELVCVYGKDYLGYGFGAKACSYNTMVYQGGNFAGADHNYGTNQSNKYMFNTVHTRNNGDTIHLGDVPVANTLTLKASAWNNNTLTLYIADGEKVNAKDSIGSFMEEKCKTHESTLAIHKLSNVYRFGYYVGDSQRIDRDGNFIVGTETSEYYADGTWKAGVSTSYEGRFGYKINLLAKKKVEWKHTCYAYKNVDGTFGFINYQDAPGWEDKENGIESVEFAGWYIDGVKTAPKIYAGGTFNNSVNLVPSISSEGVFTLNAAWNIEYGQIYKLVYKLTPGEKYLITDTKNPELNCKVFTVKKDTKDYATDYEKVGTAVKNGSYDDGEDLLYIPFKTKFPAMEWTYNSDGTFTYGNKGKLSYVAYDFIHVWGTYTTSNEKKYVYGLYLSTDQNHTYSYITNGTYYMGYWNDTSGFQINDDAKKKTNIYVFESTPSQSVTLYDF